jgi:hypothetical protein
LSLIFFVFFIFNRLVHQSLVGIVLIDAELGIGRTTVRFPAIVIGRRLEPLDVRTDPKPDSTGGENQKKSISSILSVQF